MADRPILFSAPMVRALLAGTKTQTRRMLKPQPYPLSGDHLPEGARYWNASGAIGGRIVVSDAELARLHRYVVGDRLWARESWRPDDYSPDDTARTIYMADAPADILADTKGVIRWKPSIHMHRARSRITLLVTEVRVQRLQDISDADAIAEGVDRFDSELVSCRSEFDGEGRVLANEEVRTFVPAYRRLWDRINGTGAWDANPWVAATSFIVHVENIDALQGSD